MRTGLISRRRESQIPHIGRIVKPCTFHLVQLVCLTTLCYSGFRPVEAQTQLSWKFSEGERLRCTVKVDTVTSAKILGVPIVASGNQTFDVTCTVMKPGRRAARIQNRIDRLRLQTQGFRELGFTDFDFDSTTSPPNNPFHVLVGVEFISQINERGELLKSDGPRQLARAMSRAPQMAQIFGSMLQGDGLKPLSGETDLVLPEGSVSIGDVWKARREMHDPFSGNYAVDMTYEYMGPEMYQGKEYEKIEYYVDLFPADAATANLERTVHSQEYRGVAYFDRDAGRLYESRGRRQAEVEVASPAGAVSEEIDTEIVVTFELLSDADDEKKTRRRRRGRAP